MPLDTSQLTLGIDVSAAQGPNLDWRSIAASGVRYAFIKATEGQGYVDPCWDRNAAEAKRCGLLIGAYHYFWPNRDADDQAEHFFKVAGSRCDLPPAVDWETNKGMDPSSSIYRAYRMVNATEALWKRGALVYSYPSFIKSLDQDKGVGAVEKLKWREFMSRDLWIAHYGVSVPYAYPWKTWRFWQYDGNGGRTTPQGIDADFNYFNGTYEQLVDYCYEPAPDTAPSTPTSKSSQSMRAVAEPGLVLSGGGPATPLRAGEGEHELVD